MTAELGMYGGNPTVKVGEYSICTQSQGKIWIQRGDGEGAEFDETDFGKAVEEFYKTNF